MTAHSRRLSSAVMIFCVSEKRTGGLLILGLDFIAEKIRPLLRSKDVYSRFPAIRSNSDSVSLRGVEDKGQNALLLYWLPIEQRRLKDPLPGGVLRRRTEHRMATCSLRFDHTPGFINHYRHLDLARGVDLPRDCRVNGRHSCDSVTSGDTFRDSEWAGAFRRRRRNFRFRPKRRRFGQVRKRKRSGDIKPGRRGRSYPR